MIPIFVKKKKTSIDLSIIVEVYFDLGYKNKSGFSLTLPGLRCPMVAGLEKAFIIPKALVNCIPC